MLKGESERKEAEAVGRSKEKEIKACQRKTRGKENR